RAGGDVGGGGRGAVGGGGVYVPSPGRGAPPCPPPRGGPGAARGNNPPPLAHRDRLRSPPSGPFHRQPRLDGCDPGDLAGFHGPGGRDPRQDGIPFRARGRPRCPREARRPDRPRRRNRGALRRPRGRGADARGGGGQMSSYTDPGQHLFWIASRALGVVALVMVAVSVGLGLAMALRSAKGPGAMAKLKQAHEATALVALMAIAAHGLALLGDSYLRPGLSGIAIPFAMSHRPLWTGL